MTIHIRESEIEDALASSPVLVSNLLNLDDHPRLLVRQMPLRSGRLDLLYTHKTTLLLIELKVVGFQQGFVEQVLRYKLDLASLQQEGKLLRGDLRPFLLCPYTGRAQEQAALGKGVFCVDYDPALVLQHFFQSLRPIASLSEVKPIDIGIWNIHLINEILYLLPRINSVVHLRERLSESPRTLYNKIKFAHELRLVEWIPSKDEVHLSDLGSKYVEQRETGTQQSLSDNQVDLLSEYVMKNPYASPVTIGIASVVEAVFALAKNTHPVEMSHLLAYFAYHSGKHYEWKTKKAKYNATRMYSNYAVNLGLLGKSGDSVYLTPKGIRFTISMQLHKSLKMMETMTIV